LRFYAQSLGLHLYREWSSGSTRGVVFFLGGGFLELSGSSRTGTSESVGLWLQVPDVDAVGHELEEAGVDIIEPPTDKPWGLREMQIRDPDGLSIVIVEVPETHPLRCRRAGLRFFPPQLPPLGAAGKHLDTVRPHERSPPWA
jgi:predicted enzyme related to lactoylglutathione lyase